MHQRGNIALVSLIVLLLLAGVVFFLVSQGIVKNPLQKSSSLGGQIFNQVQNSNQGETPETNPFAKINPFKGVYKNPFE